MENEKIGTKDKKATLIIFALVATLVIATSFALWSFTVWYSDNSQGIAVNGTTGIDFDIYYSFGVGEKNVLDSANNLYVKDMICNGETQKYSFVLADEDKEKIKQAVIASSFFDLKETYEQQGDSKVLCSPSTTITLTITMDGKTNTVHREECAGSDADIRSIIDILNQIIQKREDEFVIKEPECGYI